MVWPHRCINLRIVIALIKRMNSKSPTLFDQQVDRSYYFSAVALAQRGPRTGVPEAGFSNIFTLGADSTTRLGLTHETAIWGTTAISGPNTSQVFIALSGTTEIWETTTTSNN